MADSLYEVAVHALSPEGQDVTNTLHIRHTAAGAAGSIANDWATDLSTPYRAMLPDAYTLQDVAVREILEHSLVQPGQHIRAVGGAGTRISLSELLPAWCAVRATFYSGFAGRRHRGASSFAGGTQPDVEALGVLHVAEGSWWQNVNLYLLAVQAEYDDHTTKGQWVIFSRKTWTLGGGDSSVWAVDVQSFIVHGRMRSMRSRQVL